ncbi:MAG: saccharopine dehydrogenase NADP-binding domain-containing protein [Mobilicoccus sp.]|nr:saccharopine dehydrogenase NADP-binding domain-containing protein [Mobilicoccus sp.]
MRDLDIVLVGATGFVGRLTARHLAEHGEGARIALAGRDAAKLEALTAQLPEVARGWERITLDVSDAEAVAALSARTAVVCTTVGPYEDYGKTLAAECAKAGTHYCDLTGEITFVRWSLDTVGVAAQRSGAHIVHSCGFDSIPSDLGVYITARAAAEHGDGHLLATRAVAHRLRGGLSGGTLASMRGQFAAASKDDEVARLLADPYALSPDRAAEPEPRPSRSLAQRVRRLALPRFDGARGRWVAPFFMAPYNTRVVRWSNAASGWSYGRDFRYSEVHDTGRGLAGAATAAGITGVMGAMGVGLSLRPTRALLDRVLPAPGEGPDEESMARGRFAFDIEAVTTSGARYRTRLSDDRDPGYTGTAVMLGQSALSLALDDLDASPGVSTPSRAMGSHLADRLVACGWSIETTRL